MTTHAIIECLVVTSVVMILKELKAICEESLKLVFFMHTTVKARSCLTLVLWLDNVDFNDGA